MRPNINDMITKVFRIVVVLSCHSLLSSCEDFVKIDAPKNELIRQSVFDSDAAAQSSLRGLYHDLFLTGPFRGSVGGINILGGLCSDELFDRSNSANYVQAFENAFDPTNSTLRDGWNSIYKFIYFANSILEGLENSSNLSSSVRNQLEGESKFVRAFCYFYLVNLWGDVPLILTTDYRTNRAIGRTSSEMVYDQILLDLLEAESLLGEDYAAGGGERIRPNKWAAKALLARVYLFLEDWVRADQKASEVIEQADLYSLPTNLNEVFLKNSTEAIWQILAIAPVFDTWEGQVFLPTASATSVTNYPLTNHLISEFEMGDLRLENWINNKVVGSINFYYPYKYKVRSISTGQPHVEYSTVLRLAEVYLIRAESRARLGNITGPNSAQEDLNRVRTRSGLPEAAATSESELLLAIERERRCELFSEWGHRWVDLIRTRRADVVLGPVKQDWQTDDILWPIPQAERSLNPNLSQNPGY